MVAYTSFSYKVQTDYRVVRVQLGRNFGTLFGKVHG